MATKQELEQFFDQEFPQADFIIEHVGARAATLRKRISQAHLRPGGTVSGPVLMEIADAALYVAILGELGLVAMAVTTSLNFNFLSKPASDRDLIAECTLMKVGRTLVVGEVSVYSDGIHEAVAHAVGSYAIPSRK